MLNTPFSPWPSFTAEEADAVREVLLSNKVNYWTGRECREFENHPTLADAEIEKTCSAIRAVMQQAQA